MREQWEAAQAGLRVFLDEDNEYVQFLADVEEHLALKLRFTQCSRVGGLVEKVAFDRFVETLPQLQSFHILFQGKLKQLTNLPEKRGAAIARGKCNMLVEVMADMLSVLRVPYAQLFSRSEATQTALEQVLSPKDKGWDGDLLENFLMNQKLTAEELVGRPLQRFNAVVEFVEALSTTLVNPLEDDNQRWADTIGGFLEMNGTRSDELYKNFLAACKEDQKATARPSRKKSRRLSDRPGLSTTSNVVDEEKGRNAFASPVVKTPKRKWLKRKSDDPDDTALVETQPCPTAPTDESMSEIDPTQASVNEATEVDEPKDQQIRIILTGVEITPAIRKKIDAVVGAVYEEDIEKATHVLAPKNQLKRTVKLLCGISRCVHILDVRWLDESARVGVPVYERTHCLKDAKAEAKWNFDLTKTMYDFSPAQRRELFTGQQVFITSHKSVLPPVRDLVKIVECAGGKAVTKGTAEPDDLVITSDAAMTTASVRKALAQANPKRIYSPELILSGILQQHIDLDKNHLERVDGGNRRRR
ncbi:hypothetical protein BBO99_00001690 [Phytophthora kernoviae]|uniref:BRCT domain-containing protein n=2 Tax=Phytophthora kernoviae TaxID=325452 RepID=A0A3R7JXQ8_9STRA|nr:hypothetical protein G195_005078 [Phytophthora kernoviae 00238/432]KAG2527341.1 hypothetical protein JM18_003825 [Phytophthora kernoviae]RLN31890.1 hypothetical protein BBI17_000460 [Phytophthora kernoviae]RLN83941.1 hypothetical protein BBO99_00001690 [Phytophthora kernoviae]